MKINNFDQAVNYIIAHAGTSSLTVDKHTGDLRTANWKERLVTLVSKDERQANELAVTRAIKTLRDEAPFLPKFIQKKELKDWGVNYVPRQVFSKASVAEAFVRLNHQLAITDYFNDERKAETVPKGGIDPYQADVNRRQNQSMPARGVDVKYTVMSFGQKTTFDSVRYEEHFGLKGRELQTDINRFETFKMIRQAKEKEGLKRTRTMDIRVASMINEAREANPNVVIRPVKSSAYMTAEEATKPAAKKIKSHYAEVDHSAFNKAHKGRKVEIHPSEENTIYASVIHQKVEDMYGKVDKKVRDMERATPAVPAHKGPPVPPARNESLREEAPAVPPIYENLRVVKDE